MGRGRFLRCRGCPGAARTIRGSRYRGQASCVRVLIPLPALHKNHRKPRLCPLSFQERLGEVRDRIDFLVPFGVVERWRFKTGGNAPHPVHVHGISFQVVSRTGGRGKLFPWEGGWKDSVLLNDKEVVDVLVRFDAYRGLYVIHCHQLEHESMGMMSNFEVV